MLATYVLFITNIFSVPTTYSEAIAQFEQKRIELADIYKSAQSTKDKQKVIDDSREEILNHLTQTVFPAWYGTTWTMSGRTSVPGQGEIACGTFVGSVLKDAGFKLNRIRLGQLASEHIAQSLTDNRHIRRYSNQPYEAVAKDIETWGSGLYLLGLDYHAALIYVDKQNKAYIVHSSYYINKVIKEPIREEEGFKISRYRVVGKLLDNSMIKKWLKGQKFKAKTKF